MIFNLYVAVILAIAVFDLAVGSYTAYKAYKIEESDKLTAKDQTYELEKDYYLVSTVGWMTLGTRLLAIPLFWVAVMSLIPAVPGAMCEFGVFQAGAPYSWADFVLKLFTVFAFGGWLFIDFLNRKLKSSPMMRMLSKAFVLLLPLLFVDALLDIAFFASIEPLVVPCCMVIYSNVASTPLGIGCPFCYVTFEMPLLMGAIPLFAISGAILIWSLIFKRKSKGMEIQQETAPLLSKAMLVSTVLAVIGTILLIMQIVMGPAGIPH